MADPSLSWWVYIVQCSDGSYYTGIARDLDQRIQTHNAGRGARYTQTRRPVNLKYSQAHPDRSSASKREYAIKRLSRAQKILLIQEEV